MRSVNPRFTYLLTYNANACTRNWQLFVEMNAPLIWNVKLKCLSVCEYLSHLVSVCLCVPLTCLSVCLWKGAALVHVYTDGSVALFHGGVEMGQGLHTKMIQVSKPTSIGSNPMQRTQRT